jgi:formiminoglutamase
MENGMGYYKNMKKFDLFSEPNPELFYQSNDPNDVRLGEIIPKISYEDAKIVILGYPNDEGVIRNKGRAGAALAPDAIRIQFYQLTPLGLSVKICDLGNLNFRGSLEETHDAYCQTVGAILRDNKKIISLGGGNDLSYPDGRAMSEVYGAQNWLAINVDSHFNVRADEPRNSGTAYRQLIEEKLLKPDYFYEVAFQTAYNSPVYFQYLQKLGVNLISLEQLRSKEQIDAQIREALKQKFIHQSKSLKTFFGFDLKSVRASDAPGTSNPSPTGLRSGEFLNLVKFAADLAATQIIEFTDVNPNFDFDNRTSKLVAIAMHQFCSEV